MVGAINRMRLNLVDCDSSAFRLRALTKAFLLIALAGSFFVDLANAFIVKAFLALPWFR